jgi:hypothetical protein
LLLALVVREAHLELMVAQVETLILSIHLQYADLVVKQVFHKSHL